MTTNYYHIAYLMRRYGLSRAHASAVAGILWGTA
jgi:hypothetical protein